MPGRPRAALKLIEPLEELCLELHVRTFMACLQTPGSARVQLEAMEAVEAAGWALDRLGEQFRKKARITVPGPFRAALERARHPARASAPASEGLADGESAPKCQLMSASADGGGD